MSNYARRSYPLFLLALLPLLTGCPFLPQTVDHVDLDRYLGLWYEIASYPTFFNEGLVGTTAEYTLRRDGRIRVYNSAFAGDFDGPVEDIEGIATVIDRRSNAKLSVSFPSVPLGRLFQGQYWIIDLDEEDYSYAVVTNPLRTTLFILSRSPEMDPDVLDGILDRLEEQNFDLSRLLFTPQLAS